MKISVLIIEGKVSKYQAIMILKYQNHKILLLFKTKIGIISRFFIVSFLLLIIYSTPDSDLLPVITVIYNDDL